MKQNDALLFWTLLWWVQQVALAKGAAPSSHAVYYENARGNIVSTKVMVPQTYTYTYYEAVGWSGSTEMAMGTTAYRIIQTVNATSLLLMRREEKS